MWSENLWGRVFIVVVRHILNFKDHQIITQNRMLLLTGVLISRKYSHHYQKRNVDFLSCTVGGIMQVRHIKLLQTYWRFYSKLFQFYISVPAIRKYSALNGLSTETYETLHKSYVKNPYQASNKRDVMKQLVNAVSWV